MPCTMELTCFTMVFMIFFAFCVCNLQDRFMLSGLRRKKYSSLFFDQYSIRVSGSKTIETLYLFSFRTLSQLSIYVVISDNIYLNRTMIHKQTTGYLQKNMVDTTICIEMCYRHYVQIIYLEIILLYYVNTREIKPWVQYIWGRIQSPI